MRTASAAWIFLATLFLWNAATESKVYYGCGAVMNPTGRDLILSPGFPNYYLPGSHCLWQIFVPAGSTIELETLDFDIYERTSDSDTATSFSSSDNNYHLAHKRAMDQTTLPNDLEIVSSDQTDYANEASNHILAPQRWDETNNGIKSLKSQDLTSKQNIPSLEPGTPQTTLLSTVTQNSDGPSQEYNKPMNLLASLTSRVTTNVFQQNGIRNTGLDVNELQLVVAEEDLQNRALESTGQAADVSQQMHQEDPTLSSITVTDSQSDEVFVISAGDNTDCFTFNTYPLQEGSLRRSVTSPASVSDWLNADYTSVDLSVDDKASEVEEVDEARKRTWSSRTFNSLLPQLQMKWRSRSSSGSFTKLVDSCCTAPAKTLNPKNPRRVGSAVQIGENSTHLFSESSDSNASYPLTQSAKLQRKLPPCNLRRTRPYFGLLNDSSDGVRSGQKFVSVKENHTPCQTSAMEFTSSSKTTTSNGFRAKELSLDFESPSTVFVICEEADDQQPLVFDDQLSPATEFLSKKHEGYIADDCYLASTKACSRVSTRINSAGDSAVQCTENKMSLGSAWNVTSQCTTVVGRQSSAVCTNFPSTPIGLVTE